MPNEIVKSRRGGTRTEDFSRYAINTDHLSKFLTWLDRDWFHLYSSDPNNPDRRRMRGYVASSVEAAIEWVERQQRLGRNIYYALNTPSPKQTKKAKKEELRLMRGFHVDWDLPEGVNRADPAAEAAISAAVARFVDDTKTPCCPTLVMSGNGVQALWLMRKVERATTASQIAAETINKQLMQHFGAPSGTHNSERILRLPGTWNFPDDKKRERGCVPVLSELICIASDDVDAEDFGKLPHIEPVKLRPSPRRRDWTLEAYRDWTPWRWSDLVQDRPDFGGRICDKLKEFANDRSRAAGSLLHEVVDFVMVKQGCPIEDMLDDPDVYKQIAELCWEGAEYDDSIAYIMGHYEEHEYERAQLGYDIAKYMDKLADDNRRPTETAVRRIEARAAVHEINRRAVAGDVGKITVGEAEKAFTAYVSAYVQRKDLPEADMSQEEAAKRQPATVANLREALRLAKITARWDMMRNEPRFFVDPDAGSGKENHERPAIMWDVIMNSCSIAIRAQQEMATIRGALINAVGMTDETKVEQGLALLASSDPYHPLEDYCLSRAWDGVDRIRPIADCLDTDHPLKHRYMEMFFYQCIGAICSLNTWKRTGQGLQLGYTLLLVGPQNIGKSTFWERVTPHGGFLAPGRSLKLGTSRETDSMEECLSGLVCVLNELAQTLDRSDANALKDFQTATLDVYRAAYARHRLKKPRMTVLTGTANPDHQLRDQTGTRRWLSMIVRSIDQQRLNELTTPVELQQVYAQAYHMVMSEGRTWRLSPAEEAEVARQNEDQLETPYEIGELTDYLATETASHRYEWMTATQICKVIGIRYTANRWPILKTRLDADGFEYRAKVRVGEHVLQKVWGFPVLPEKWDEVRLLR